MSGSATLTMLLSSVAIKVMRTTLNRTKFLFLYTLSEGCSMKIIHPLIH